MGTVLWERCVGVWRLSTGPTTDPFLLKKKLTYAVFTAYAKPVCGLFPLYPFLAFFHLHFFVMAFTIPYFFQRMEQLIPFIHASLRSSFRSLM